MKCKSNPFGLQLPQSRVGVDFPLADALVVLAPFFGFVGDEFAAEFGAEDLLDEGVGGEGFDGFVEGAGEFANAAGGELVGGEFVEVVFLRIAGVEFFADAFEAGGENEGGGEVGVAAGIGVAAFAAASGLWVCLCVVGVVG